MHKFLAHIKNSNSRFKCYMAGGSNELSYVAHVKHRLNPPASIDKIAALKKALGEDFYPFLSLYEQHDGLELYIQKNLPAIYFYPLKECKTKNKQFKRWFSQFEAEAVNRIKSKGIAFAEIGDSSNLLILENGIVSYFNWWDGGQKISDLPTFLNELADDPAKIMNQLGCMVRFYDENDTQYVPRTYEFG